jgi:hypothetical protein
MELTARISNSHCSMMILSSIGITGSVIASSCEAIPCRKQGLDCFVARAPRNDGQI